MKLPQGGCLFGCLEVGRKQAVRGNPLEATSCERQPPRGKLLKGKQMPSSRQKSSLGNLLETSSSKPYTQRGNLLLDTLFDMPLFSQNVRLVLEHKMLHNFGEA